MIAVFEYFQNNFPISSAGSVQDGGPDEYTCLLFLDTGALVGRVWIDLFTCETRT